MMKIAGIMNDIYFFCYKNLLITDRLVVKPCWLFCRKFASSIQIPASWLMCAAWTHDTKQKSKGSRNSYVVALGKIMLKLP